MSDIARTQSQILSWKVSGMDCASCAATIRGAVERLPGVSDVKLSVMTELMTLSLDESRTRRDAIEKRVASLGYKTAVAAPRAEKVSEPAASCCSGHDHAHHDHGNHRHGDHGH